MTTNKETPMRHAILAAAVLGLAACQSGSGQSGNSGTNNTLIVAGIGALSGAGIGLLTSDTDDATDMRQRAVIGAGIGALAGAGIGYYLDQQAAALEEDLAGTSSEVYRQGDAVVVNLPGGVTFDIDSTAIRQEFYAPLNRVATTLREYPQTYIDVIGHTDSTGSASYNQDLSQRRALSVGEYLVAQGVAQQRFIIGGRGETQPVASNATVEGRARNRRVEIILTPVEG